MINKLLNLFRENQTIDMNMDDSLRITAHKKILRKKEILKYVFKRVHDRFDYLDKKYLIGNGVRVEIGSGVAEMKVNYKDVLSSDVVPNPELDLIIDAMDMNLESNSVRVLFLNNTFHHIPDVTKFFKECERVLIKGGGLIILEPYYGPLARILYKNLFKSESFDISQKSWLQENASAMVGANQAMSYIVFKRDREIFEKEYPRLHIIKSERSKDWLLYLLSGGLNFRQLIPNSLLKLVEGIQFILSPLSPLFAIHHIILIKFE